MAEETFLDKLRNALNKSQGVAKTRSARDWFARRGRALKAELRNKFTDIQKDEKKLIDDLNEKYGDGTLDLESGTFISNKSK